MVGSVLMHRWLGLAVSHQHGGTYTEVPTRRHLKHGTVIIIINNNNNNNNYILGTKQHSNILSSAQCDLIITSFISLIYQSRKSHYQYPLILSEDNWILLREQHMSTFDPFNFGVVLFYYLQSTLFGFVDCSK